jgi:metallophosphoesterase superfamily enzyme
VLIEHGGHRLELFPSGAILWNSTLLVADLHLGKESVFQKSGLAIPTGATEQTLLRLQDQLASSSVERLVVLGDLLHAPAGWTADLERLLGDALQAAPCIRWELVAGNHDRRSHDKLRNLGWVVHSSPVAEGRMLWMHEPPEGPSDGPSDGQPPQQSQSTGSYATILCGHLHPSLKVPVDRKQSVRVRCYWIRPDSIVLPAFGGWVGTHPIEQSKQDRIILCVEDELIEWKL